MTKTLFILAGAAFLAMVGAFIGGLSSSAAGLLMLAFLCIGPLFMLFTGMAIGRATFEFSIVRNNRNGHGNRAKVVNTRIERAREGGSSLG